jgi:hypothetical protein
LGEWRLPFAPLVRCAGSPGSCSGFRARLSPSTGWRHARRSGPRCLIHTLRPTRRIGRFRPGSFCRFESACRPAA